METPTHDQNPIVATRRKLFQRHSAGEIKLEINPISYHETKEDALKNEYAAIAEHRPPYNSFTGPKPIPAPKAKPNRIDSGSLYINFKFANEEVKATALSCMMEAGVTNLTAYINALIVEDVKNNP